MRAEVRVLARRGVGSCGHTGRVHLTARDLNRTLLARQHLLERTSMPVAGMVAHLVGLQAQENLPPYLSLAARLDAFDPYDVTRGLEDRSLVRLLTMRGTIHLLLPDDALTLRAFTQPAHERERKVSQNTRPGDPPPARRGPRRRGGSARRRSAADEGSRRGDGRARPRGTAERARPPRARRRTPRAAAAAWLLAAVRRRGLRPGGPLAGPAAGRRPTRRRSCGATSRRSGRPPPPTSPRGPASPGSARWSAGWTTWSATTGPTGGRCTTYPTARSSAATSRRHHGCWGPTTTCGSPTPGVTG